MQHEDVHGDENASGNVYVSIANNNNASAPSMQNEYERERMIVTQAVVHTAPQRTGEAVNRSISPFDPRAGLPTNVHDGTFEVGNP